MHGCHCHVENAVRAGRDSTSASALPAEFLPSINNFDILHVNRGFAAPSQFWPRFEIGPAFIPELNNDGDKVNEPDSNTPEKLESRLCLRYNWPEFYWRLKDAASDSFNTNVREEILAVWDKSLKGSRSRLCYLMSRLYCGQVIYDECDIEQLRAFCRRRHLEIPRRAIRRKRWLISILERADEETQFERLFDLPAEPRNQIYEHHFPDIDMVYNNVYPPPLVFASRQLYKETLGLHYGRLRFEIVCAENAKKGYDFDKKYGETLRPHVPVKVTDSIQRLDFRLRVERNERLRGVGSGIRTWTEFFWCCNIDLRGETWEITTTSDPIEEHARHDAGEGEDGADSDADEDWARLGPKEKELCREMERAVRGYCESKAGAKLQREDVKAICDAVLAAHWSIEEQ